MPTITATAYNTPAYVLVQADWTDQPDVTHATVTRRNTVTDETVTLRPYISYNTDGYLALSCGRGLWWDTEPPLNVPLEYCTIAADVQTVISDNPDFEVTVLPWTATGGAVVQSGLFSHSGNFSAQLTPTGTSPQVSIVNDTDFNFEAGKLTTVSAWLMCPIGWNAVRVAVTIEYDNGIIETISTDPVALDNSEWRYVETAFTPTINGTIQTFTFHADGVPTASHLFYIDEIQVTQPQPNTLTDCETVTVTSDNVWLKSPLNPCSDLQIGLCTPMIEDCEEDTRISYGGMDSEERPANTIVHEPVNQKYPIPTNRQRRSPRSTLRLITHDCDARDAVIEANQPGDPLLFQAPATYCIPDRYISVGTVTETRISIDQREDFRMMTLPYVVVARPAGSANAPCGIRIEDLCDIYTSWQAVVLNELFYLDLLLGSLSHQSPTNPLPADARVWDDVETEFVDWDAVEAGGTRDWDELRDGL